MLPDEPRVTRPGAARWARVGIDVMRDPELPLQAKAVYALLATYADDDGRDSCYPRQETMAEQLGVSVDTIQRHLAVLVEAGVVEVEPRFRPDGGRSTNDYQLHDALGEGKGRTSAVAPSRAGAASASRTSAVSRRTPPEEHDQEDQYLIPGTPPSLLLVSPSDAADFDAFWQVYPRKVGKGQALKAYKAAAKHASAATILAGLQAQLPVLRSREAAYIPHAATWLNGQRWLDDVTALQAPATGRRNHSLEALVAGESSAQIIGAAFGPAAQQMLGGGQ